MIFMEVLNVVAQWGLFLATVAIALIGYYQLNKIREQCNADFIARLNREFFYESHTNRKLIQAVEKGQPILEENKGAFEEIDLYGYLRYFEMIERFIAKGIISFDLAEEMFGGHIARAWENKEIKEYIVRIRGKRKDRRFFEHFEKLAKEILENNKSYISADL
jgi:hypothetical protein